jgi:hypothetical protein
MKALKCGAWAISIVVVGAAAGAGASWLLGGGAEVAAFIGFVAAFALAPLSTRYLY